MGTTARGIAYPDAGTPLGNIGGLFGGLAESVDDVLPVIRVSTLAQLNSTLPSTNGVQLALQDTTDSGIAYGTLWSRTMPGWRLASPVIITSMATFQAAIQSLPNVASTAGCTFYSTEQIAAGMFTDDSASYMILEDGSWSSVAYPAGRKWLGSGYQFGYKVTRSGIRLRGNIARSSGTFANGETIITLPVGARPNADVNLIVCGSGNAYARVDVHTDGTVVLASYGTRTSSWYSFDNVEIPL